MRVIGGQFRSRQLRSLPGNDLRPTSDRLRETLFDVLTAGNPEALRGTVWIDAFAGTGAVGIEALSRAAAMVYFVERARGPAKLIGENLQALSIEKDWQLIQREAGLGLRLLDAQDVVCDFCFLDPPYRLQNAYPECLGFLSTSRLLSRASVVIAEHHKKFDPGEAFGSLQRFRKLVQGDAVLSFYRRA